jgi:hypothetical protein
MNSNKSLEHFVTLFDSNFLPQGLALHSSLERHLNGSYKLWILCLDDQVFTHLNLLSLSNIALLKLSQLETLELLTVKTNRTLREYCWTLTPFAPSFVFEADKTVKRVTYLDADTWLMHDPTNIFSEFNSSGKSVLITDHAYAVEHDQSQTSGKYCVQFITFTRDQGEIVRKWWEDKCLIWCYAKCEDGKFGDQKYLEGFVEIFPNNVHVAKELSCFMAPWNATRFSYLDAILWHFHGLRIIKLFGSLRVYLGDYFLPNNVIQKVYLDYLEDVKFGLNLMNRHGIETPIQSEFNNREILKYLLSKYLFMKNIFLQKNLIKIRL